MINAANNVIIGKLPGNQAIVLKEQDNNSPQNSEAQKLAALKKRDAEVRAHEAAHMANPELVAVGGPKFKYAIGPDGKAYAVGGSVTVSTGNPKNADDAIRKALALKSASVGTDGVSSQDLASAISAQGMLNEALTQKTAGLNTVTNTTQYNNASADYYTAQKNLLRPSNENKYSLGIDFTV